MNIAKQTLPETDHDGETNGLTMPTCRFNMLAVCMAAALAAAHVAEGVPALVPMPREIDATGGECVLTK